MLEKREREPSPLPPQVHVGDYAHITRDALAAHRTQVPATATWFRVPVEVLREVYPWEDYTMAATRLGDLHNGDEPLEDDLFAGLR